MQAIKNTVSVLSWAVMFFVLTTVVSALSWLPTIAGGFLAFWLIN